MRNFDIVRFGPDSGFISRLGYSKVYCAGTDVDIKRRITPSKVPLIIEGRDPGVLITALRDSGVAGIIFEGNNPIRRVVEKAAEMGKTVFMPVGVLINSAPQERGKALSNLRKTAYACTKLGTLSCIISLAESKEQMLSSAQILAVADLIIGRGRGSMILRFSI
ncbi:MAG: hypothetical protein M1569_03740 [Candidatus Marsarchaeota archaeon]|nr:hypothetical protein [Candidatus Marsarchaeota archaeon]MCL5413485.1 hypothetical protein [Candidatus Marsarchaeota archaeon]